MGKRGWQTSKGGAKMTRMERVPKSNVGASRSDFGSATSLCLTYPYPMPNIREPETPSQTSPLPSATIRPLSLGLT